MPMPERNQESRQRNGDEKESRKDSGRWFNSTRGLFLECIQHHGRTWGTPSADRVTAESILVSDLKPLSSAACVHPTIYQPKPSANYSRNHNERH